MPSDNVPAPEGTPKPTPGSIPPPKKGAGGKIVVMLSSVAKAAPGNAPSSLASPAPANSSLKPGSGLPITGATLTGPISSPPPVQAKPPPLPAKLPHQVVKAPGPARSESKITGNKRTAPIKLNLPSTPAAPSDDSIFLTDDSPAESTPDGWKELTPGELLALKGDPESIEVFSRSTKPGEAGTPAPAPSPQDVEAAPSTGKKSLVETGTPEAKPPEAPPLTARLTPLVHLPPVGETTPPTNVKPAIVLAAPIALFRPPSQPSSIPLPAPSIVTAPPPAPVKSEQTPLISLPPPSLVKLAEPGKKPQPPALPTTSHLEVQSPSPAEPAAVQSASALLKVAAPAVHKLPPPLPPRTPISSPEIPAKSPAPDDRPKPPALPLRASPPVILPPFPGEAKAEPASGILPQDEAKTAPLPIPPSLLAPVEAKTEAKPGAEPEQKPATEVPLELPQASSSVTPGTGLISEVKPAAVTGPISVRDAKPSLRPPVLPARLARELQEKAGTPPESSEVPPNDSAPTEIISPPAPPPEMPSTVSVHVAPPLIETKPAELEKHAPPALPTQTPPTVSVQVAPPLIEAKPAQLEKYAPPVLLPETPSTVFVQVAPPLIEAKPAQHEKNVSPLIEGKPVESEKQPTPAPSSESPSTIAGLVVPPLFEAKSAHSDPPVLPPPSLEAPVKAPALVVPPMTEAKPAESEKLKPPVRPEEKPVGAGITTAASPYRPAEAEKSKSPLRPEAKVSVRPAPAKGPSSRKEAPDKTGAVATDPALTPRAARARKRRLVSNIFFYALCLAFGPALYYGGSYFCHETRIEGQIIPPQGMLLGDEVWIVTDFRDEAAREAEDLADRRTPMLQDIQRCRSHVQRAQSDIAAREERIRLLQGQIQASKDEIDAVIKKAKDAAQQLWSGPGAQIDQDYDAREQALSQAIADRAKALKLDYEPDPNFNSPEVWANAYRLALYQVPKGVDSSKELLWLGDEMKQWRDFTKSTDDRKEKLREQVAAVKLSPVDTVTELQTQVDDLQHRIDSATSEETPIKTELEQAQSDLAQAESKEDSLDPTFYAQLDSLPESKIVNRLPLSVTGRFSWRNVEKDHPFSEGVTAQSFWLFTRAVRSSDGRQYWALNRITVDQDSTYEVVIEPEAFISTKAILRPDLSPEEQQQ
jgi:predicted  nucleic acid-binding Zn-ribbon protein